jgi:uncharacterized protein YacL
MGFIEALLLTFIILKLTGVIAWPWFAVLLPLLPDVLLYATIAVIAIRKRKAAKAFIADVKADFKADEARWKHITNDYRML